jgi:hypothetical protein
VCSSDLWEANLTANPTKNITLRATFAYTDKVRSNMCTEIHDYYTRQTPVWEGYANTLPDLPARDALIATIRGEVGNVYTRMVNLNYWNYYTYANGDQSQITTYKSLGNSLGARLYKFNIVASYKFDTGALKGLRIGAGARYQSGPIMPANDSYRVTQTTPENDRVYRTDAETLTGTALLFFDANASYRCRILHRRVTMTIQVNIRNIFNSDTITQGRQNFYDDGSTELRRVYLNPPRQITLTTTFNF